MVWDDLLLHMDRMNRYSVSPFDNMPFVWLPEAERDENYVERRAQLKGWSKIDPRIRPWGSQPHHLTVIPTLIRGINRTVLRNHDNLIV